MIILSILRELHTKSVYFGLACNNYEIKLGIFTEIPIRFGVEGYHPREWVIFLEDNIYRLKDSGLACFEN